MTQGDISSIMKEAMMLIMLCSAPMLVIALAVGLLVAIFQATTQIQEATLAFGVKIIAVIVAFLVFGPWILTKLVDFTETLLMNMNTYIK